jgi:hypothetical protein
MSLANLFAGKNCYDASIVQKHCFDVSGEIHVGAFFLRRTVFCYNEAKARVFFFAFIEANAGFRCESFLLHPYNFFATIKLFCHYEANAGFFIR